MMASITESHKCPLEKNFSINLALFANVSNSADLTRMAAGGTINAALINPFMVFDRFQVLTAATAAVHKFLHHRLMTRNIHSEILYNLSPSKQIAQAFKNFGVNENIKCVLVVEIANTDSRIDDIVKLIKGDAINLDKLSDFVVHKEVMQFYKVKDDELKVGSLVDAVVARMTTKEFVKY